jgi:hypothetical protein
VIFKGDKLLNVNYCCSLMNINKSEESIVIPRILYHGTTDEYLKKMQSLNMYKNLMDSVCMLHEPVGALSYGMSRAKFYKCLPVLLIVDRFKLDSSVKVRCGYEVDSLNFQSFLVHGPLYQMDRISKDFYTDIAPIVARLINYSNDEIKSDSKYILNWYNLI